MRKSALLFVLLIVCLSSCIHNSKESEQHLKRPKIVIGLVIDQMRWDYLYRFNNMYREEGFVRLMKDGYNCQNTNLNYLPSFTAPGHTCIYTGSVPSLHGIAGNNWIDPKTGNNVYCVDDKCVSLVGDTSHAPSMSPANLLTTTITDELRLATNQKSRVYGVALKDRGSILPAGHLANGAYWYNDKTGAFTSSTYYPNQNPKWLQTFNSKHYVDSLVKLNWKLLYDPKYYSLSTVDANTYEKPYKSEKTPVFPHIFDTQKIDDKNAIIKSIPAGNSYTLMMAKACMEGEKLGFGEETDFLAISLSSTDYIGHQFGPNSIEIEDMYLRLDKEIASFLKYLDMRYGEGNYLFFLTADHGGAHNASFLSDHGIPAGVTNVNSLADLNTFLNATFGKDSLVLSLENYQVSLNERIFNNTLPVSSPVVSEEKTVRIKVGKGRHAHYKTVKTSTAPHVNNGNIPDREQVKQAIMKWLGNRPEVSYVIDLESGNMNMVPEPIKTMVVNGYYRPRSGVIQFILNPGWYDNGGRTTGTTHGTWNPYDVHIPLLWYGWHIKAGETNRPTYMTDISATLATLLHIQAPNGCIGKPITEITDAPKHEKSEKHHKHHEKSE